MITNLGDFATGETVYVPFHSFSSDDPSASMTITGLAVTDIEIYKDGSTTQRASDNGYTLLDTDGIDFDSITGLHGISIDLSDNSDAGFFAAGSTYWVAISSITIDGATINFWACVFTVAKTGGVASILTDTEAVLADSEAILTDSEAILTDSEAILVDTEAATGVITDTEAIIIDTEAAITERATLLTDTEAILSDTEFVLTDTEAILADTEAAAPVLTDTEAILVDTEASGGLTALATGTAQSGTASTIVLASGETFADNELNGNVIKITGGTGAGQSRVILSNTNVDDTCNVFPNWATNPSSDSAYEIVEGAANVVSVSLTSQTAGDIIADTEAVLIDTEAVLADTETGITERATLLTDTEALLVDTEAATGVITDTEAIIIDTEAAITERATLLTDTEAILSDTEALGLGSGLAALATGTAQSGTASTIVLASGETFADNELNGNIVKITSGTGAGQSRLILSNTNVDDTCNVSPNWATNPSSDSTYEIVEGAANLVAVGLTTQTAGDIIADTEILIVDTEAILSDTESLGLGSGLTALATGTAQSGTASTVVLASGETFADNELNGNVIKITGGTGAGQSRLILSNTNVDDTCNIAPNWATNPSSDSTYEIVDGAANLVAVQLTSQTAGDIISDTEAVLSDTEFVLTDTEAILADTEAATGVITDTEAILGDTEAAVTERATILTDTEAGITERATLLTDTEAILSDTEFILTDSEAILIDTEAATGVITDTEAILIDTEAGVTERATLLIDTEALLVDTEAIIVDSEAILADTETRLPAALVGGNMPSVPQAVDASLDIYQADIEVTVDVTNSKDEYTVRWKKNGIRVTSGITVPTIQVVKRADGTDLVASTAMSEIGSTGSYKYDETTNRLTDGEAIEVIVAATIDSGSRTDSLVFSRDSTS